MQNFIGFSDQESAYRFHQVKSLFQNDHFQLFLLGLCKGATTKNFKQLMHSMDLLASYIPKFVSRTASHSCSDEAF